VTALEVDVALAAAAEAGALLSEHFARGVTTEWKGRGDVVTVADRESEAVVRRHVAGACPDDLVVGEEGEVLAESAVRGRRRWYVDPLDGTTNFVKGQPRWAVAVAFCDADDRMAAAVVFLPMTGEVLAAERGAGARRVSGNGAAGALVVDDVEVHEALALLGPVGGLTDAIGPIGSETLSVRVTGSTVTDLADVAAGRAELFLGVDQGRWDLAAGVLVASEAGAVATDMRGTPITGPVDLAFVATPAVHAALLPRLAVLGGAAEALPAPR
jgi:myo-inositol-1(or 4)-monophosphatase